ncbi:hypothetical protein FRB99_001434 [Tulasnella sp. 403]|nr:hypothetical protein FRB99_001434 [Tulasnella sp. 403]
MGNFLSKTLTSIKLSLSGIFPSPPFPADPAHSEWYFAHETRVDSVSQPILAQERLHIGEYSCNTAFFDLIIRRTIRIDPDGLSRASGGFYVVVEGYDDQFGRVAVRTLRLQPHIDKPTSEQIQSFVKEVDLWRKLQHPHVLPLHGTYRLNGSIATISPWAANGTLKDFVLGHPHVPRRVSLRQAADGIQYLHKQNIIHGDIKPTNILVMADGRVVVCDFNLSRLASDITDPGLKGWGSFRYMAPELWKEGSKSRESDVYAFGMSIYEVLSGFVPFHQLELQEAVMYAVLTAERPPQEPSLFAGEEFHPIWTVAAACWDADPTRRPSASEVYTRMA